jgi:hypothetical protein
MHPSTRGNQYDLRGRTVVVMTPWAALPGPGPVASVHVAERGVPREGRWPNKPSPPGEASVTACGARQWPAYSVRSP